MAFSVSVREDVTVNSHVIAKTRTVEGSVLAAVNETIPAETSDYEIPIAIDVSSAVLISILSDVDCVIKTNDAETPDDTIELTGGVPYNWDTDGYNDSLIATDVTVIFVDVPGEAEATLQMTVLSD